MNGEKKLVKTEIFEFELEDLLAVKVELEWMAKKIGLLAKRLARVLENAEKLNEYELEDVLYDICEFVGDCKVCPLRFNCKFVVQACTETYMCETCPRLRLCVRNGNRGVYRYIRDCKLMGGEE